MNRPHEDGSMTLDNASVQRLMDCGLLHYTAEGWFVGTWNAIAAGSETAETGETRAQCEASQSGAESASPILPPLTPSKGVSAHD